jgi:hypothetical protein
MIPRSKGRWLGTDESTWKEHDSRENSSPPNSEESLVKVIWHSKHEQDGEKVIPLGFRSRVSGKDLEKSPHFVNAKTDIIWGPNQLTNNIRFIGKY